VRKALLLALVLAAAASLSACGTGGLPSARGDQNNGAQLFTKACGGCHQLQAAGTQGNIGPNLDAAFAADREQGYPDDTISSVVLDQIRLANPPMPRNLVKGQDAIDVADYVAATAGVNGSEAKAPSTTSTDGKTIFTTNCGSCHTLKAAGTKGTIGPNLDQVKPPPTFALAQHQVENGGGVMPAFKGRLTDKQITSVAHFVADNAGK
jgi:cbb3-type cytochrome c oxidase subunit III